MKWPSSFNSVHNYLDELFVGIDPSEEEIISAKKWYWRCYNTDLKRRRSHYTHLSIYFSKDEIQRIKQVTEKGKVSDFVKKVVLSHLDGTTDFTTSMDTSVIEEQLFLIAEYLLELINMDTTADNTGLIKLENQIALLQTQIEQLV